MSVKHTERAGLYILVILCLINSCSADNTADRLEEKVDAIIEVILTND